MLCVGQVSFAANTEQLLVTNHPSRDVAIDRERVHSRISVRHERVFIERRADADEVLDLVLHFELERIHQRVEMDLVQGMHSKHLGVSFTTTARTAALRRLANLRNDQVRRDMACALIQAGVDLARVVLLDSFTEGRETERLGIQIRISSQNIEDNAQGWAIVTGNSNRSMANGGGQLAPVAILHLSEGVEGLAQGSIAFGVARHPQVLKEQIAESSTDRCPEGDRPA